MSDEVQAAESAQSKRERQRARKAAAEAAQREARKAEQKKSTAIVIAIIAAVAVILGGAWYMINKNSDPSLGFAPVSIEGNALPNPEQPGENATALSIFESDNAKGMTVPTIKGKGFDGKEHTIGKGAGKPQAIAAVAHWCHFCQEEVAQAKNWVKDGMVPDGIELIAITTHNNPKRPNWPPTTWFEKEAWPAPVIYDAPSAEGETPGGDALGVASFPTWIFTDAEGKVVGRVSGAIGGETFKELAEKTLASK